MFLWVSRSDGYTMCLNMSRLPLESVPELQRLGKKTPKFQSFSCVSFFRDRNLLIIFYAK